MGLPFLLLGVAIAVHYARLAYRRRKQAKRPCFGCYTYKTTYVTADGREIDSAEYNADATLREVIEGKYL